MNQRIPGSITKTPYAAVSSLISFSFLCIHPDSPFVQTLAIKLHGRMTRKKRYAQHPSFEPQVENEYGPGVQQQESAHPCDGDLDAPTRDFSGMFLSGIDVSLYTGK